MPAIAGENKHAFLFEIMLVFYLRHGFSQNGSFRLLALSVCHTKLLGDRPRCMRRSGEKELYGA